MENLLPFDQEAYHLYMDDLNNSQGFYITPSRDGSALLAGVRPVTGENSGDHHQRAERAARFAVEEHNKSAGQEKGYLKFKRIINLNRQPTVTAMYYITMEVADVSGESTYYEAKVWEKLNTGYKVLIFRPAPYLKSSDLSEENVCSVGINGLLPWMNESYIYYKCFYRVREELLGVDVLRDEQNGVYKGVLWFKSCAEAEKSLKDYVGEKMPCSDKLYDFDLKTCHRNCIA